MADQPAAIARVSELLGQAGPGLKTCVLRGATGTGKTFVVARALAELGLPALVLSPNKTLAAQLSRELQGFLPDSAVEMFVSYYDSFMPESYKAGVHINKRSVVNRDIDAMRHRATKALVERRDIVVVASVSCIYGLGVAKEYLDAGIKLELGSEWSPLALYRALRGLMYAPAKRVVQLERGTVMLVDEPCEARGAKVGEVGKVAAVDFAVDVDGDAVADADADMSSLRSGSVLFWPPYSHAPITAHVREDVLVGLEWAALPSAEGEGGATEGSGSGSSSGAAAAAFPQPSAPPLGASLLALPARHFVVREDRLETSVRRIENELAERCEDLSAARRLSEAARLRSRVERDISLLRQVGYCPGIENYSRHLALREAGQPPDTLVRFFSEAFGREWVLVVDESHVTLPQLGAMGSANRSRVQALVDHGFRLPSALDNRPLAEREFWPLISRALLVSATPGRREVEMAGGGALGGGGGAAARMVDMVVRPTHIVDPPIEVRPRAGQLADVLQSVRRARAADSGRTLILTVTKRDAEDMAEWLAAQGVRVAYLHSGLKTPLRSAVLRRLREGQLEAVVGISLLREGLDLPEVSQVLVLDCDREGFLRSAASLVQMCGRAARNAHGRVVWYADRVTDAMQQCLDMTERRREVQLRYQREHGVRPSKVRNNQAGATPFDEQAARAAAEVAHGAAWQARARAQAMARGEEPDEGPDEQEQEQQDHSGAVDGIDWEAALKLADADRRASRPGSSSSGGFSIGSSSSSSSSSSSLAGASGAELGESGVAVDHVIGQPGHIEQLRSAARELERRTGVYLWRANDESVLYVGKAKNLRERALSYLRPDALSARGVRLAAMLNEAATVQGIVTPGGERDALLLEASLIKRHQPLFNVLLRDDRFYPFITVAPGGHAGDPLPRVATSVKRPHGGRARRAASGGSGKADRDEGVLHFGPFTSPTQLRRVLQLLEEGLQLKHRRFEAKFGGGDAADYLLAVQRATRVLQGDAAAVAAELEAAGEVPAARAVRQLVPAHPQHNSQHPQQQHPLLGGEPGQEAAAVWGQLTANAQASRELQALLSTPGSPRRVEGLDASHDAGEHVVVSNVVFVDNEPVPHLFGCHRVPHARTQSGRDDPRSLASAVAARFAPEHAHRAVLPDVLLVDGGEPQLRAAHAALAACGIDHQQLCLVAIVKPRDQLLRLHPRTLELVRVDASAAPRAHLALVAVRDAAHRAANTSMHRARRRQRDKDKEAVLDERDLDHDHDHEQLAQLATENSDVPATAVAA